MPRQTINLSEIGVVVNKAKLLSMIEYMTSIMIKKNENKLVSEFKKVRNTIITSIKGLRKFSQTVVFNIYHHSDKENVLKISAFK